MKNTPKRRNLRNTLLLASTFAAAVTFTGSAMAGSPGDRILATGGVTQFEGAAGGGLTPWALIAGYGSREQIGATVAYTKLGLDDYDLDNAGFAVGFYDRVEVSYMRQSLDISSSITSAAFGALSAGAVNLGPSTEINQDVFGLKVKLFGDAVFSQASWLPQVSLGLQHKRNKNFDNGLDASALGAGDIGIPQLLGATKDNGTDIYLSATKAILGVPAGLNMLVNVTARASKANTLGFLGFETSQDDGYDVLFEGSLGIFFTPSLIVGIEARQQSDNLAKLGGASVLGTTDTAIDAFIAYVPNKRFSVTAAYVDLGNLPFQEDSKGGYLSLEYSF